MDTVVYGAMSDTFGSDSASTVENTPKGRMMAKSADELKKARESRAADALKMKDDDYDKLEVEPCDVKSI